MHSERLSDAAATATMREEASLWCVRTSEGLDDSARQEFEAWLNRDPRHERAYLAAVALWRLTERRATEPEFLMLRRDSLTRAHRAGRRRWNGGPPLIWGIAAALVATVGLTVTAAAILAPRKETPAAVQTWATAAGQRRLVELSDGSKIRLDGSSIVSVRYSRATRELILAKGQASFEVAKNPERPFTVTAGGRTVLATGTAFSVDMLSSRVVVTLMHGRVSVFRHGLPPLDGPVSELGREGIQLLPAQQLIIGADGGAERRAVDLAEATSWEQGKLVFDDEPLSQAVERVNRESATEIVLDDETLGKLRVNGVFNAGDAEAFAEGVVAQLRLRSISQDGRIQLARESRRR